MSGVKELREARGWSQSELSRRAGLHSTTVCLIESGRQKPYPVQLQKIAAALGVEPCELEDVAEDAGR